MNARDAVLAALRVAGPPGPAGPTARGADTLPPPDDLAAVFLREARAASSSVATVATAAGVPAAVAAFLAAERLPPRVRIGRVEACGPWPPGCGVEALPGVPGADGEVLVTGCAAALADVGAVVLLPGGEERAEGVFLAETHVVVVRRSAILPGLDDLWPVLGAACPDGALPRTVNIIRGPSRTADLGVPSRVGVHGPRRVHVILVEGA